MVARGAGLDAHALASGAETSVDRAAPCDGEVWFELTLSDAWVWDMYRPARFVKSVRVLTFKDVNVEELEKPAISLPADSGFGG